MTASINVGKLRTKRIALRPAVVAASPSSQTIANAVDRLRALRGTVPLPETGSGWRTQPESWYRLAGQICAVGSSRSWEALQSASARDSLAITRIRSEGDNAPAYVHAILAALKVRYCSPRSQLSAKANAIAQNANSPFIADADGTVCMLQRITEAVGEPGDQRLLTPDQARMARRLLIQNVRFFGPKSASDFLIGQGLADSLLALDVRLLNLLIDLWGFDPAWRDRVHRLDEYERLENTVVELFCPTLEVRPVELDRLLFYGYPSLKKPAQL